MYSANATMRRRRLFPIGPFLIGPFLIGPFLIGPFRIRLCREDTGIDERRGTHG
jgi:hypothetical protein